MKYKIDGKLYEPIKMGDDGDWYENGDDDETCGDCGIPMGDYHLPNCDIERCPVCGGQFLSCEHSEEFEVTDDKGNLLTGDEALSREAYSIYMREYYGTHDREACVPVCFNEFYNNEWQDSDCRTYYIQEILGGMPRSGNIITAFKDYAEIYSFSYFDNYDRTELKNASERIVKWLSGINKEHHQEAMFNRLNMAKASIYILNEDCGYIGESEGYVNNLAWEKELLKGFMEKQRYRDGLKEIPQPLKEAYASTLLYYLGPYGFNHENVMYYIDKALEKTSESGSAM